MLKFDVQNQTIERTDTFRAVADSKNYLKAEFTLTEEWQGGITAVFGYGGSFYRVSLDDKNSCTVPWEVIKPPLFTVSLFCGEERLVTANVADVKVEPSGMKDGAEPTEPTPEIWQQYISKMQQSIENMVPHIGEDGNWYFYNTVSGEYEDSGILAAPEKGVDYWTDEDKAEIKGEVEPFVITVDIEDTDSGYEANNASATFEDALSAHKQGKAIFVRANYNDGVMYGQLATVTETMLSFINILGDGLLSYMCFDSYNNWELGNRQLCSKSYVDEQVGHIEAALDGIIAIQNELMGVSE